VNHFGVAIGAITVVVIGGAVVLDRVTSSSNKTTMASGASATPVKSEAGAADTSTKGSSAITLADAGKEPSIPSAQVDSRPQGATPGKSTNPPKPASSSARISRQASNSKSTALASGNNNRDSMSEPAPTTPAVAAESVAAAPAQNETAPAQAAATPAQSAAAPAQNEAASTGNALPGTPSQEEPKPAR